MFHSLALTCLRVPATAFWLLTIAFGIVSASPFAFEMFIRPRLVPWVNEFVAWHHAWYPSAYLATAIAIGLDLRRLEAHTTHARLARRIGAAYIATFGVLACWLATNPVLPLLDGGWHGLVVAGIASIPLVWMALFDHVVGGWSSTSTQHADAAVGGRVLVAGILTAAYLWLIHFSTEMTVPVGDPRLAWTLTAAWTFGVMLVPFLVVAATEGLIAAAAVRGRHPQALAYALTVLGAAALAGGFLHAVILPAISMEPTPALVMSAVVGATLALSWSGVAWRTSLTPSGARHPIEVLCSPKAPPLIAALALLILPAVWVTAGRALERLDWEFILQRTMVAAEAAVAFGLMLSMTSRMQVRVAPHRLLIGAALTAMALVVGIPHLAMHIASERRDGALQPSTLLEPYLRADSAFRLASASLVRPPGQDPEYYRFLQLRDSPRTTITIPEVQLASDLTRASRRPDIFMIVVDSLRRDYLSPYNEAVRFTPGIGRFADESFVFRNAFTRHGGTELAIPSIWSGSTMVRRARAPGFERMNALEKLLNANDYRIAINDFTVQELLRPATPLTVIDEGVPSADTDLCANLTGLKHHLGDTRDDPRPVFAFFAPMNVHVVNTRRPDQQFPAPSDTYAGFYPPYASRLSRIDGCFQEFIAYLKEHGRYENSIVILTSDHGDSLGEDGRWGHVGLFPEVMQVPLIIRLPADMSARVTTDLARIAFTNDIAPTLYELLEGRLEPPGLLHGAPLFVDRSASLTPRRRGSYLVTASYTPTYGLIRRNGSLLYISDLYERKEFAFDLTRPGRRTVPIENELRRVSRTAIRHQVTQMGSLFRTNASE